MPTRRWLWPFVAVGGVTVSGALGALLGLAVLFALRLIGVMFGLVHEGTNAWGYFAAAGAVLGAGWWIRDALTGRLGR
jgi:hypothetical protein